LSPTEPLISRFLDLKGRPLYERKKRLEPGFNPASRAALLAKMKPLVMSRCPFRNLPTSKKSYFGEGITADDMKKLHWLKPRLVAQVRFTEWTSYGLLHNATFGGLRNDKGPAEVTRDQI